MASFTNWQAQLLRRLGMPVTARNVQFLTAWQAHEGGSAANNPLNTTQGWKGASDYNSVGVKNYGNPNIGLLATAKTLRNGYYPAILSALKSGNPTWNPVLGKNLSTWGTGSSWMGGYRNTPVPPGAPSGPTGLTGPTPQRSNPAKMQFIPAGPRTITRHEFDPLAYSSQLTQSMLGGQTPDWANMLSGSYKDVTQTIPAAPGAGRYAKMAGPGRSAAPAAPTPTSRKGLVAAASKQLGQPYVWGGESRKEGGFDCSGLVDWAARQRGYNGPRLTTYSIAKMGTSVKGQQLRPGDLVISNGGEHVAIYAGNGKVLVSPHTGTVVQWQTMANNITDVRRVPI